jgi:hypothetical protein
MRGTFHQAVERARLFLLALALLLCVVPTAQAMRCPIPTPALDSLLPQLNEEMPSREPDAFYGFWMAYSDARIGLFVGNNPIDRVDFFGLAEQVVGFTVDLSSGGVSVQTAMEWAGQDYGIGLHGPLGSGGETVLTMGGTMVPGVGEFMDMSVLTDPASRWWERGLAGGSLFLNVMTDGFAPNVGPFLKAGKKFCRNAAETAPKLLNPGINITEKGMEHVLERHIVNGIPEYATKSKFTTGVNLEELIQQGTQMPMVRQANGNFARTFDAGRAIGIDRATGQASSVVTIITKPNGNLVTMFPGAP